MRRIASAVRCWAKGSSLPGEHIEQAFRLLEDANLEWADLSGVRGITNMDVEIQTPVLLKGATMPNGRKYEDWLKDKGGSGEG
jgi:hypothetical protein